MFKIRCLLSEIRCLLSEIRCLLSQISFTWYDPLLFVLFLCPVTLFLSFLSCVNGFFKPDYILVYRISFHFYFQSVVRREWAASVFFLFMFSVVSVCLVLALYFCFAFTGFCCICFTSFAGMLKKQPHMYVVEKVEFKTADFHAIVFIPYSKLLHSRCPTAGL